MVTAQYALDRVVEKLEGRIQRHRALGENNTDALNAWERGFAAGLKLALEDAQQMQALVGEPTDARA